MLAFAQQKRMAFKEQVTIYTDDTKQYPLLGFKARQRLDLGATYDVTDADGQPIGLFRKDFARRCCARRGTSSSPAWRR